MGIIIDVYSIYVSLTTCITFSLGELVMKHSGFLLKLSLMTLVTLAVTATNFAYTS